MAKRSRKKKLSAPPALAVAQPWWRTEWAWAALLVAAVIAAYLPVWRADFVWDDDLMLTNNPCIVGPFGLKQIWVTSYADICPLTLTTFWLAHALWGLAPLPYHLLNIALQATSAVLLWRVLRSLQIPGAWLGSALWALHPVQAESAVWIAELKNMQSGVFYLFAILFFVRHRKTGAGRDEALTILFAALAMLSKSSAIVLPAVLLLAAWWIERRWRWRTVVDVAPMILMSIVVGIYSMWTQRVVGAGDSHWVRTWPGRLAAGGDAVWFYLGKLLWPHPLMAVYPRWQIDPAAWSSYLGLVAVGVVTAVLWWLRDSRWRPVFFAWAYFLVALSPVLGLVSLTFFEHSFVSDHLQYLAAMGPLALVGAGLARVGDFASRNRPAFAMGCGAALLLALGAMSWQRACVYENPETLWTDTLAKNPACWVGYTNLGDVYFTQGRLDDAIASFQKTLAINPSYGEALSNLGNAYLRKDEPTEAIRYYARAVEIDPGSAKMESNLGAAYYYIKQADPAILHYQRALAIDPWLPESHNNLGLAFVLKGDMAAAAKEFATAVRLKPDYGDARQNLDSAQTLLRQAPANGGTNSAPPALHF